MKKILAVTLSIVLCFALVACSSGTNQASVEQPGNSENTQASQPGQVYKIKCSISPGGLKPEESAEIMYTDVFKKYVEENSKGAIVVEMYPSNQLGSPKDVVQSIVSGNVQMGLYDISMITSYYPNTMLLATPGLFKSVKECDDILKSAWAQDFYKDIMEKTGMRLLGAHSKGFRCFTTKNKELKTYKDAKGVTFRVMESPVYIKMVEALGAHAVPMPGSEMYVAMQNGVVDGQENAVNNILQDKTYEVQKYLVLDEHAAGITGILMNGAFYDNLPGDLQKVIDEAHELAVVEAAKVIENRNTEGVELLKEYGMSVYQPTQEEKEEWQNTVLAECEKFVRSEIGDEVFDGLLKVLEDYRAKN